jgi:hypothetical protein
MRAEFKGTAKFTKKASARKTPVTKTVAKKVATLSAQVAKLNKISYDKYTMVMARESSSAVVQPYYQYHLQQNMNNWVPIFGSVAADINQADKMYINSYKLDVRLTQGNEADRIFYTAFLVSLKDQGNDASTFDPATGTLGLVDNVHFITLPDNGRALLNEKFFNIHAMKRFVMGGRPGDQSTPETRDLSFTLVPKQKLIVNPRGNVLQNASFSFPKDPSQNYYFLLFNDDSAGDLQTNKIHIGGLVSLAIPS